MRFLIINANPDANVSDFTDEVATYYVAGKNAILDLNVYGRVVSLRYKVAQFFNVGRTTQVVVLDESTDHQFHCEWNGSYNDTGEPIDSNGNLAVAAKLNHIQGIQYDAASVYISKEEISELNKEIEDNFG